MSEEPEPPATPLSSLLGKLSKYAPILKELGYDEVNELGNIGDDGYKCGDTAACAAEKRRRDEQVANAPNGALARPKRTRNS